MVLKLHTIGIFQIYHKMITFNTIGYAGNLGNQLFQLSALLGTSKKNNFIPSIPVEKNKKEKLDGCLNLFTNKWISFKLNIFDCFDIDIYDNNGLIVKNSYNEPHFHFDENIFNIKDETNINGFFQSELYFKHIENDIRQLFEFKKNIQDKSNLILNEKKKTKLVSIHVRRSDYLGLQHQYNLLDVEYYQKAINLFDDDVYQYLIFSDDINWCKEIFGKNEMIDYIEGNDPYIDLYLMSQCDHNIIANSTFSWWGAWLNKNKNKKVIVPSVWFNPNRKDLDTKDMIPKDWIKI